MMTKLLFSFSLIFTLACSSSTKPLDEYPDHWWKPLSPEEQHSWEIPPQAAKRENREVILSKRNELGLMSNFAATPFELDGKRYASLEGLWQSMKYAEDKNDVRYKYLKNLKYNRSDVEQLEGHAAYKAGKAAANILKKHGITWVTYQGNKIDYKGKDQDAHYDIIYRASWAKVEQNKSVKEVLLETEGLKLLPDHKQSKTATPAYYYFKIYEDIRDELLD